MSRLRRMAGVIAVAALLAAGRARAIGPENTLLVVNGESGDSKAIAAEYARLRAIPDACIVTLSGLAKDPVIGVEAFRRTILGPALEAIRARGLSRQIDAIIYSAGFPYAVDVSADIAGRKMPMVVTQPASITGLTYMADLVMVKDIEYLSLDANRYARRPKRGRAPAGWSDADRTRQAEMDGLLTRAAGLRQTEAGRAEAAALTAKAAEGYQALATARGADPDVLYNLSCALALLGRGDAAMAALTSANAAGWSNASMTESDGDLASIRGREDYRALIGRMRAAVIETQAPRAFSARTGWMPDGEVGPTGRRYMLSAMLAYIGPVANSYDEAMACIRRARTADGAMPQGTIYYMESDDAARTGPRQWAFGSAAANLRRMGVNAQTLKGVLPPERPDVMGAMVGIATFDWSASGSTILPGAFCDHLTSCGGIMTGGGQTLLSEFIRSGAAGACGTVTEPYNTPTKFPTAFVHQYYAAGCTLVEAFYQSVTGPYQQLLVGDPLCRPWGVAPQVKAAGLKAGSTVTAPVQLTVKAGGGGRAVRSALYVDGVLRGEAAAGAPLVLRPAGLSPGLHEARVVVVAEPMGTTGRAVIPFRTGGKPR